MLFEIVEEGSGFGWRLLGPSGDELASSGTSYSSREDAERAAQAVRAAASSAEIQSVVNEP